MTSFMTQKKTGVRRMLLKAAAVGAGAMVVGCTAEAGGNYPVYDDAGPDAGGDAGKDAQAAPDAAAPVDAGDQ